MSLSVIARAPVRSRTLAWSRSIHVSSPVRSGHGAYTTVEAVPFNFKNRPAFAFKIISFFGLGLSLPVIAASYQLWKK